MLCLMVFSLVQTSTLKYTYIRVYLHTEFQPIFTALMDWLLVPSAYVHFVFTLGLAPCPQSVLLAA